MKKIAYNIDILIPGVYFWIFNIPFCFFGVEPDNNYPGKIKAKHGFFIVFPGLKFFTNYFGDLD